MNKKKGLALTSAVLLLLLSACGGNNPAGSGSNNRAAASAEATMDHSMHSMAPPPTASVQPEASVQPSASAQPGASGLSPEGQTIEGVLNGLSSLENEVNKGDFEAASAVFEGMHEQYHTILALLKEKQGSEYTEKIHPKFDALEDAVYKKDKAGALTLIKDNREILNTAAHDLGVSLGQ